jgi:hypothetical protein
LDAALGTRLGVVRLALKDRFVILGGEHEGVQLIGGLAEEESGRHKSRPFHGDALDCPTAAIISFGLSSLRPRVRRRNACRLMA